MDTQQSPVPVPPPLPTDAQDRIDRALSALGFAVPGASDAAVPKTEPVAPWRMTLARIVRRRRTWFALYGVALLAIAFWPQPVDSGAGRVIGWLIRVVPGLTYERLEFGSNIALFVPFGIAVGMLLRRHRYLVLPVALLATLTIESAQAVLLPARTPSLYDILANVAGASIGLIVLATYEELRRRRARSGVADGTRGLSR